MLNHSTFRINQPAVIGEVVDGEAIVVNLESGAYYSLRDSAGVIWEALSQGTDEPAICALLHATYSAPATQIEESVAQFIAELVAEGLIVPLEHSPITPPAPDPAAATRPPFSPPQLEKYTDMADLLLLDPIHEVDPQSGWPQRAPK